MIICTATQNNVVIFERWLRTVIIMDAQPVGEKLTWLNVALSLDAPLAGKLYVHGLLRTLNMRADLRRRIVQEDMLMHNVQPWLLKDKVSPAELSVCRY